MKVRQLQLEVVVGRGFGTGVGRVGRGADDRRRLGDCRRLLEMAGCVEDMATAPAAHHAGSKGEVGIGDLEAGLAGGALCGVAHGQPRFTPERRVQPSSNTGASMSNHWP
ncbi:hypothetical protein D3C78_1460710 [compost metagenome]